MYMQGRVRGCCQRSSVAFRALLPMCCTAWGLSEPTAVCQQHARRIHAVEEALSCHSQSAAERGLVKLNQSFSIFPFVVVIHWEVGQTEVQLDRRLHLKRNTDGAEKFVSMFFSPRSKSGSFPASVPFRVFDSRHAGVSRSRRQEESCSHLQGYPPASEETLISTNDSIFLLHD